METEKVSNIIKCLTGELSSGILSPNDTFNGKNVYELLKVKHRQKIGKTDEVKQFNKFMETGKNLAMKCLTGELSSRILSPNDTIAQRETPDSFPSQHQLYGQQEHV